MSTRMPPPGKGGDKEPPKDKPAPKKLDPSRYAAAEASIGGLKGDRPPKKSADKKPEEAAKPGQAEPGKLNADFLKNINTQQPTPQVQRQDSARNIPNVDHSDVKESVDVPVAPPFDAPPLESPKPVQGKKWEKVQIGPKKDDEPQQPKGEPAKPKKQGFGMGDDMLMQSAVFKRRQEAMRQAEKEGDKPKPTGGKTKP